MIYSWKPAAHINGKTLNPQVVGERLMQLREDAGGLTPPIVVEDARPPSSSLHPAFEWDDEAAAEQYRLYQARNLLRAIVVRQSVEDQAEPVRAFVVIRGEGQRSEQTYEPVFTVLANRDMRAELLARAYRELEDWRQRYHTFEELAGVFVAIEQARATAVNGKGEGIGEKIPQPVN